MRHPKNNVQQSLDELLKVRFHGAANVRGIQYQILYSILRSLEIYTQKEKNLLVRLEGIEDVDLLGLQLGNEYVQVKSYQKPWNWSKLKDPLQGFLPVHRADPTSRFVLAVNFPLQKEIAQFAQRQSLPQKQKEKVEGKFQNLCQQVGASTQEANEIAEKLMIVSLPAERLWEKLRIAIAETFELGSEIVDTYLLVFVAKFLGWAEERKTLTRSDLDNIRVSIGERFAREEQFEAYGRSLIKRISWEPDQITSDFFEGKGTRAGHIAANIDVIRPMWLENISKALQKTNTCILRSSSGQGKSTLLFRYAYENWPPESTFILRSAETQEQVEHICSYLRFLAELGLPVHLLIDDAGWRTRLWPLIVRECASLGILVLVTVRNEDWYRFGRESLTDYEVLEPLLGLGEARQIYQSFQSAERLDPSIQSPDWAYEKIGEPHLLLEYVYLLTYGRMLEERLRDQVKQFSEQNEDSAAKIEILRRTALASYLGAPVNAENLVQDIPFREDPQAVLLSLAGEYIALEDGLITELHWVRSDHLVRILHEGYPDPVKTALTVLEAVPQQFLATFAANVLCMEEVDRQKVLKGLAEKAQDAELETLLAILAGIFEAGERELFLAHQELFDEAETLFNPGIRFLLSVALLPIGRMTLRDHFGLLFRSRERDLARLEEIVSRASNSPRGFDLCREFLRLLNPVLSLDGFLDDPSRIGCLLDWCALCNVDLRIWPSVRERLFQQKDLFDLPLDDFCNFTQGLFRYDEERYLSWFSQEREKIIGYLKFHTDCIELNVSEEAASIEFFPEVENGVPINEQAVSRLEKLGSALPFCQRYQSRGIWYLPLGLTPSVDDTQKNLQKENNPFKSDVQKNVIWRRSILRNRLPDTYFAYQEAWYKLRLDALSFVQGISQFLEHSITRNGSQERTCLSFLGDDELPIRLDQALQRAPRLGEEYFEIVGKSPPANLKAALKENGANQWIENYSNFFSQFIGYLRTFKSEAGRLVIINFSDATKYLQKVHLTFGHLFEDSPDYFEAVKLNGSERECYLWLADLLNVWINNPPNSAQRNIRKYIQTQRERARVELLQRLKEELSPLEEVGMAIILPTDVYIEDSLRYLSIAFSVSQDDPFVLENELRVFLKILAKVQDAADIFCPIPIYQGEMFLEGGYKLSARELVALDQEQSVMWESLTPRPLPDHVLNYLPPLSYAPSSRMLGHAKIFGLIGEIQVLLQYQDRVETLHYGQDTFEQKLYERYQERFAEYETRMGSAAAEAKGILKTEFMEGGRENFEVLESFLEAVEEQSRQRALLSWIESGALDVDGLLNSINAVFGGTPPVNS